VLHLHTRALRRRRQRPEVISWYTAGRHAAVALGASMHRVRRRLYNTASVSTCSTVTRTLAEYMYTATVSAHHGGSGFTAHELNCTAPLCEQPHCPELVQCQQTYFCCSQSSRGTDASCVTGSTCCRSVQFMYCEPSFVIITIPANTCSGYNNAHTNQPAGLMAFGLFVC